MTTLQLIAVTVFFISLAANRFLFTFSVISQLTEQANNTDYYLSDGSAVHLLNGAQAAGCILGSIPLHFKQDAPTSVVVLLSGLISSLATGLFPLADSVGLATAILARLLNGLGIASQSFLISKFILKWVAEKDRNRRLAILLASYPMGAILCSVLMFSTNDLLGWRAMYYTMAGVTVPATVIYAFLERPGNAKLHPIEKSTSEEANGSVMDLLKTPAILASLFCFCGMYVGNTFYAYYTNLIIKETTHWNDNVVALFGSPVTLLDVGCRMLVGHVAESEKLFFLRIPFQSIFHLLQCLSAAAIAIGCVTGFTGLPFVVCASFLTYGVFQSSTWQLINRGVQLIDIRLSNTFFNATTTICGVIDGLLPLGFLLIESAMDYWHFTQLQKYALECGGFFLVVAVSTVVYRLFVKIPSSG